MSWFAEGMKRPDLMVAPLFYDVLSGEFKPAADPSGRTYTLGRLSVEAYHKGIWGEADDYQEALMVPGGQFEAYTHNLSWAPRVDIITITRTESRMAHGTRFIAGVLLKNIDSSATNVYAYNPVSDTVAIPDLDEAIGFRLNGLSQARDLAATQANAFFESTS